MSKTDKIRERLKEADEYDKHLALEAVVEECEEILDCRVWDEREDFIHTLLDIIANELDVEGGADE